MIYFDHAATTPLLPQAKKAMEKAMDFMGNPASPHRLGREMNEHLKNYHDYFESLAPGKFIFTSSATESNNTILKGLTDLKKVWLPRGDHPSLSGPGFISFFNEKEIEVGEIPFLKNGKIDLRQFLNLISEETENCLIAFSLVDGQTGVQLLNAVEIGEIKNKFPKVHLHLDGSQALGKINSNLKDFPYDSLTICSHKIGGPVGIAGLYLKENCVGKINPLLLGGGHEEGLRSSTPSLFLMAGFMAACREFLLNDQNYIVEQNKKIKLLLEKYFPVSFPFDENACPYILGFFIFLDHPRLTSDLLLRFFEEREIYLSSSAACSSKNRKENPAISQLGYNQKYSQKFLRLSLSIHPTLETGQFVEFENALQDIKNELGPLLFS